MFHSSSPNPCPLFRPGDLNAFFGLIIDNLTQLVILSGVLIGVFGFPADLVLLQILPGCVVGVVIGDLAYTRMAVSLARRTGRTDVTAMPLGIDTPSLFAFTFGVIGPAFVLTRDPHKAWAIAMAAIVLTGGLKIALAFVGPAIRRVVPRAGLLGPIAAIAILLIAFFPSLRIFHHPIVGLVSLVIILTAIIGKIRFPWGIPGAFAGVLVGTMLYYLLHLFGLPAQGTEPHADFHALQAALPLPTLSFLEGLTGVLPFLPVAIPFALAVVIGGIDVTESAAAAGDDYPTRRILLTDGIATLVGGLCGSVVQTTPYIGHPAYKGMGGGAGYTLLTALVIGGAGVLGLLAWLVALVPEAAVAPILVFIGLEIMAQAFRATPGEHHKSVALAFVPIVAYLVLVEVKGVLGNVGVVPSALKADWAVAYQGLLLMANGFLITAMLWASMLTLIIQHRLRGAAAYAGAAALLTLFGVIHSPFDDGRLFLPWMTANPWPFQISAAYGIVAILLWGWGRSGEKAMSHEP